MRHRVVAFSLLCCLGLFLGSRVQAVSVDGLYEATVSGESTDNGRGPAASEALRQVIIRVTGRAGAATDVGLQSLIAEAGKYVQTYRSVAPGQIAVSFDPTLLEAALAKAGQRLWGRDRPQFLVILDVPVAAQSALRRDLQASGQLRGVPLAFADTRVEPPSPVREGNTEALRSVAKTFGAEGALLVRASGNGASGVWAGPAGEGSISGSAAEILDALADRLGAALAVSSVDGGRTLVVVHGVTDLSAFAAVLSELGRLPAVRGVSVEAIVASTVKLRLAGSTDLTTLRKAVRDSGHFEVGETGATREVDLVYHP